MTTPSQQSSDIRFEIGHVLFIDIVGYSKLMINEQSEQIQKLKEIVRGTEQFRAAEAEGKLLRLPTGDGGALVVPAAVQRGDLEQLGVEHVVEHGGSHHDVASLGGDHRRGRQRGAAIGPDGIHLDGPAGLPGVEHVGDEPGVLGRGGGELAGLRGG